MDHIYISASTDKTRCGCVIPDGFPERSRCWNGLQVGLEPKSGIALKIVILPQKYVYFDIFIGRKCSWKRLK